MKLFLKIANLCDHGQQTDVRTDRQSDDLVIKLLFTPTMTGRYRSADQLGIKATDLSVLARAAASFKRPLLSVDLSVCACLCLCLYFDARKLSYLYPIGSLQETAYGASIDDVTDDVT